MNLCLSFVQQCFYYSERYGVFHNYPLLKLDVGIGGFNAVIQLLVHLVKQDGTNYRYSYRYSDFDQNGFHDITSQVKVD